MGDRASEYTQILIYAGNDLVRSLNVEHLDLCADGARVLGYAMVSDLSLRLSCVFPNNNWEIRAKMRDGSSELLESGW